MPVAKLDNAPRCQHTKLNGSPCAAPARRGGNYCVFHDAAHAKQPDDALRMVEDAMSLQYALFQVMRLLTDKAIDTKRVALMLYALQIAASNLKRLHEETQEIAKSGDMEKEKSLMKELLEVLQIPETEAERIAEETAADMERKGLPPDTFTIKACADDFAELPESKRAAVAPYSDLGRCQSRRKPQRKRAAPKRVMRIYHGSLTRWRSTTPRQMCATVTRPKTTVLTMTKAFMKLSPGYVRSPRTCAAG